MRVYLDDNRVTPEGWVRTYTAQETIEMLKTRQVQELSLDNDLGEDQPEGYTVMDFLEETVFFDHSFPIPIITVHSCNSVRAEYMRLTLQSIERIRQQQVGGG